MSIVCQHCISHCVSHQTYWKESLHYVLFGIIRIKTLVVSVEMVQHMSDIGTEIRHTHRLWDIWSVTELKEYFLGTKITYLS